MRLAVPIEKLPHSGPHNGHATFLPQPLDHLVKRCVGRLGKRAQNEIRMPIKHGPLRLALFGRANFPRCPLQPRPCPGVAIPIAKRSAA
ncbi:hypothetical protein V1282_003867 [Nitrobacteraceae bacterium AZCC 2146]